MCEQRRAERGRRERRGGLGRRASVRVTVARAQSASTLSTVSGATAHVRHAAEAHGWAPFEWNVSANG